MKCLLVISGSLLLGLSFVSGCFQGCKPNPTNQSSSPALTMLSFREQVTALIDKGKYAKAIKLANQTDVNKLVESALDHGDDRWLAIYEDTLVLPGTQVLAASPSDYWVIPGTSDAIMDRKWQSAAKQFATTYNTALESELSKLKRRQIDE